MSLFFYFIVFLFGLTIGSFLNCFIYRLEVGKGFWRGRSFCPHCQHILSWQDLIPIFSFIFLKGKCRYCQKPISLQYPLVELATAIIFFLIFFLWCNKYTGVNSLSIWYFWIVGCFLIVIFVYDLKHYIIPDEVIYPAIATVFLFRILNLGFISDFGFRISDFKTLIDSLLSAILASTFFLLIVLVSRGRWMGVGDIKLVFFMGLLLSFPNILVALFLAFFIGAALGLGLIISNKKTLKSEIPFAPFLVTGTFFALFWGNELINWYQGLFLLR